MELCTSTEANADLIHESDDTGQARAHRHQHHDSKTFLLLVCSVARETQVLFVAFESLIQAVEHVAAHHITEPLSLTDIFTNAQQTLQHVESALELTLDEATVLPTNMRTERWIMRLQRYLENLRESAFVGLADAIARVSVGGGLLVLEAVGEAVAIAKILVVNVLKVCFSPYLILITCVCSHVGIS